MESISYLVYVPTQSGYELSDYAYTKTKIGSMSKFDLDATFEQLQDNTYTQITHEPLLLVLRKEHFDCPQRDYHAVHYI